MSNGNEIVIYQDQHLAQRIEVRIENETVWLNRQQIASLFDKNVKTIGKHINNALKEELNGLSTVAKFATVEMDLEALEVIANLRLLSGAETKRGSDE